MEDVLTIQRVSGFDDPDELYGGVDQQSILYRDKEYVYDTYCKNSQNL